MFATNTTVIPGCATWRRPGIHTPDRGYGFSDVQLHIIARDLVAPRNDEGERTIGSLHLRAVAFWRTCRRLRVRPRRFRHRADGAGDLALCAAAGAGCPAGADLFGQFADRDAAVDVEGARLQTGLAVRDRRAGGHADRGAAGGACRP